MKDRLSRTVFLSLLATTLLFLVALYVDVRLTIEVANIDVMTAALEASISTTRAIGTSAATAAFILFVVSIGILGWVADKRLGIVSTLMALATLAVLALVWLQVRDLQTLIT